MNARKTYRRGRWKGKVSYDSLKGITQVGRGSTNYEATGKDVAIEIILPESPVEI